MGSGGEMRVLLKLVVLCNGIEECIILGEAWLVTVGVCVCVLCVCDRSSSQS